MAEFIISTDATCDLPEDFITASNLAVIPMRFTINNEEYISKGEKELSAKEFYQLVRQGAMPKTALISPEECEQHFEKYL